VVARQVAVIFDADMAVVQSADDEGVMVFIGEHVFFLRSRSNVDDDFGCQASLPNGIIPMTSYIVYGLVDVDSKKAIKLWEFGLLDGLQLARLEGRTARGKN
jgi:hypothetical protein